MELPMANPLRVRRRLGMTLPRSSPWWIWSNVAPTMSAGPSMYSGSQPVAAPSCQIARTPAANAMDTIHGAPRKAANGAWPLLTGFVRVPGSSTDKGT